MVPWTKPENLPYHPDLPPPRAGRVDPQGFLGLFLDNSVRLLPADLAEKDLRAMITPQGHEPRPTFLDTVDADAPAEKDIWDDLPPEAQLLPPVPGQ
jgi:hypothetical protein